MDEISVRVAQQVAILSERRGWSKQASLPSDEQLLKLMTAQSTEALVEHLRTRLAPRFFESFNARDETISEFRRRWPDAEHEIINTADRISENTFNLLGLRDLNLGTSIDWH